MKRFINTLLIILMMSAAQQVRADEFADIVRGNYKGKADTLVYCFIDQFMNKNGGWFYGSTERREGEKLYWQQAHAMDVLIYYYEMYKDSDPDMEKAYRNYFARFVQNHAHNWNGNTFENPYTDDMCWIALTLFHMGEARDSRSFYTQAKTLYDSYIAKRKRTDSKGTCLPWCTDADKQGTNACTLSPACLLAVKLYDHYGTESYLTDAIAYYEYMTKNICFTDGRVEEPPLTYTQGTFAEACRRLYNTTGETKYKTKAQTYINYAISASGRCTDKGLLRHEGTDHDQALFKGVLIPYAVNFTLDPKITKTVRKNLIKFLQDNADALWSHLYQEDYPKMYCPYYWGEDFDSSSVPNMCAMASGASLMVNVDRMTKALMPLPGDINDDGVLSVADLTGISAKILAGDITSSSFVLYGDANGDGVLSVADLTIVANAILNGNTTK